MTETLKRFDLAKVAGVMPRGRSAYMQVRRELTRDVMLEGKLKMDGYDRQSHLRAAIGAVASAYQKDDLQPPLPAELADVILDIDRENSDPTVDFVPSQVMVAALEAVYEHAYRSDGPQHG